MTEAITRIRFEAGAVIPTWLLDVEPMEPGVGRPILTFSVPVDVIDMPDYYDVVPLTRGPAPPPINFSSEGSRCRLVAPGKEVRVSLSQAIVQCETSSPYMPPKVQLPFVKPDFWARLRAVFRPS